MRNDWEDEENGDDGQEDMSCWIEACDPGKQYQVVITISSSGTSPLARIEHSYRSGAIGLPASMLKEYGSGSVDGIDASAYATRLQLDYLLNYKELAKQQGFPPSDYTPGKYLSAAEILSASLVDHITTIHERLESE